MLDSNLSWYILTVVWILVGLVAVFPAVLAPMAFDSPGSPSNPNTVGFALSIGLFPLICLAAAVLPWVLQHWQYAKWLFPAPLGDLAVMAYFIWALEHFDGGSFSRRSR